MKSDDYVKIVEVTGNFRFGYITKVLDQGETLVITMFGEGESKIAYDLAHDALVGNEPVDWVSILTEIEKRIVPLLATGYTTNEIAREMSISPSTVRAHLRTLRIKLHLDDRVQLIALSQALEPMIEKQAKVDQAVEDRIAKFG